MKALKNIALAAGLAALVSGCAGAPTKQSLTMLIGNTGYTMRYSHSNLSIAHIKVQSMVRACKEFGLEAENFQRVDNGDKIIDTEEFVNALRDKYGPDVKGYERTNEHFELIR